jgi:hypothetical protein
MEEVAGVHLGFRWLNFPNADEVKPILDGLLNVEAKFQRLRFFHIASGSLYFKEDVSEELQSLFSENNDAHIHSSRRGIV